MDSREKIDLILLALGLGMLLWLLSLLVRLRRRTARGDTNRGAQRVSRLSGETPGSPWGEKILLILGIGMLGVVSGSCLAYAIFKGIDGWSKLPTPPQDATAILYVLVEPETDDFDVFLRGDNGRLYSCSRAGSTCFPSQYSAEQIAEMAASAGYFDAEPGDYPSPPRSRIVDVCQFSGVPSSEVNSTVALLEDGGLWYKPGAPYDVAALAFPVGACAGGLCGVIVGAGLVWKRVRTGRSRATGRG